MLAAAILGPAHVQVDATVGDLPSGDSCRPLPWTGQLGPPSAKISLHKPASAQSLPSDYRWRRHRARKLGFELVPKSRNVAAVRLTRLTLTFD